MLAHPGVVDAVLQSAAGAGRAANTVRCNMTCSQLLHPWATTRQPAAVPLPPMPGQPWTTWGGWAPRRKQPQHSPRHSLQQNTAVATSGGNQPRGARRSCKPTASAAQTAASVAVPALCACRSHLQSTWILVPGQEGRRMSSRSHARCHCRHGPAEQKSGSSSIGQSCTSVVFVRPFVCVRAVLYVSSIHDTMAD